ncbi:MAG: YsnF/AvaK domain-containing protein [Chloroflexaceae bacterium]|nr:YsnF/AvaK domain-containing protein [Chloroflexaceae bacterium]
MGLGVLIIPGVGPALVAGPVLAALTGAGIGAVTGGLAGALAGLGVADDDAEVYSEGVRRGGTLVVARAADEDVNRINGIMERHHPIDIDQRAESWREHGWTGYDRTAEPYTPEQIGEERNYYTTLETEGRAAVPIVEEDMTVGKRQVEGGGARIRTYVTETPVEEQVRLRSEEVHVERRPVDRAATGADIDAFREGTFEVTETREEPVVGKRARVIEEVVISKDVEERTETVRGTERRTGVDVDTNVRERAVNEPGFDRFDNDFRTYHTSNLANSGYTYDDYTPVYRYGYSLGIDDRYRGNEWSRVEPEARRHWEDRNPGTWDRVKDAVRHAWDRARIRR